MGDRAAGLHEGFVNEGVRLELRREAGALGLRQRREDTVVVELRKSDTDRHEASRARHGTGHKAVLTGGPIPPPGIGARDLAIPLPTR